MFTLATETWGRDKPAQLVERLKQVDRSIPSSLRIAKKYLVKMDKWSGMRAIDYHTLATVHGRLCLGSLVTDQKFVNFARLCGIISTVFAPSLTDNDLKLLPGRIACFQNEFIRLYGKEKVTINVHSMRHIPVDLTRYGTGLWASAFWIEKSIGVLKAFTTSQRSTLQAEVHLAHQDMATLNGRPLPRLHQNRDTLIDKDTSDPEFGVDARRLQNLARSSVEPSDPLLVVGQELIDKVCQAANVQVLVAHLGDDPSWPVTLHHNQTMLPVPVPIVQYTKALYPETDLPYVTSKGWRYAKCQVNSLNLHSRLYRRHDQKQPCYIKAVVDTDARDRSRRFYVAEVKAFWEVTCWHGPDQGRKQTVHHLAEVEWLQTVANPLAGHGLNLTDLRGVCAVDLNPAGTRNDHPSELEHSPVLVRAIVARLAKGPEGMFGRDQEQGENVDGMAEPPTPQSKRPRLAAAATTDARGPADTQLTSWRRTRTPTPKVRENQQRAAAAAAAAASSSRVGRAPSISRAPRLFAGTPTTCIFVDIQELHVNVVRSGRST